MLRLLEVVGLVVEGSGPGHVVPVDDGEVEPVGRRPLDGEALLERVGQVEGREGGGARVRGGQDGQQQH